MDGRQAAATTLESEEVMSDEMWAKIRKALEEVIEDAKQTDAPQMVTGIIIDENGRLALRYGYEATGGEETRTEFYD
jgi:hypothetical protein